ncbi:MAG: exo-alpha-sialidase [Planctomycetes bacterium]|nr:exo-alpha-sialidase [Planctomycetota bacterium]
MCLAVGSAFGQASRNRYGYDHLDPEVRDYVRGHWEKIRDPYLPPMAQPPVGERPGGRVARGGFLSVQVNIDGLGGNILGDAANEPTIAVSPVNPNSIVIAWRQFDNVASNFRQAGYAFSTDAGATWTFPGVLDPGQFRSDPVLAADSFGFFYYYSLSSVTTVELFKSIDGGGTWSPPITGHGGDKQWFTIDRTGGIGHGHIYATWNVQFSCCGNNDFARSINSGASFEDPLAMADPRLKWGTLDVGPDGTLYLAGSTLNHNNAHLIQRSTNAKDPSATPVFDFVDTIDLGGPTVIFSAPNPAGLAGQTWVATDHSDGATAGNVYVLASVNPSGPDPLDVMFIRSTDGGLSWSAPVRVNDDSPVSQAWQWFGTMSVAPNGRIDVVWNDTRNTGIDNLSELHYAFSADGGVTWSANVALSPVFDSHVGWPNQNKLGDYYHMVSDDTGASLAYAATFNGEQDVYFLRIPAESDLCAPVVDCNGNGIADACDIDSGASDDCDGGGVPDECEVPPICPTCPDCNTNMVPDGCETDTDNDGAIDDCDGCPFDENKTDPGVCGCGVSDEDSDGDGVPDCIDVCPGFDDNIDSDGDGIPDGCDVDAAAIEGVGSRYLAVTPPPSAETVALFITSDDEPCVALYAQLPELINGHSVSRLGAAPVFLTPGDWATINISDDAVLPGTSYTVQVETPGGAVSEGTTAQTWNWADTNDTGGPIDFDDIVCTLDGFSGSFFGGCTFFGSDLEHAVTNVVIDFDDVLAVLDAFAGSEYLDNPLHTDPCP